MVHAVVEESDGSYAAIIFKSGSPKYSARARRTENRPEYSEELIAAYLGLKKRYENIKVQMIYLKQKKDSVSASFSEKQIVRQDFSALSDDMLRERLENLLVREEPDCELCGYQSLCKVEARKISAVTAMAPKKKEPVFTKPQQEVIDFGSGAGAVYAVPGAGKTTALVYRMCRLLEDVDPKKILFVTFTNKAADEIRSRAREMIQDKLGGGLSEPDIYTYNGLGWQILRDHPEVVGKLKLLTPLEEKKLLLRCINEYEKPLKGYSYHYMEGRYGMVNLLKNSFLKLEKEKEEEKKNLICAGHDPEQVIALKERYKGLVKQGQYVTFDEQITIAKNMLKERPEILKAYGQQWEYIMADEFQDSSQDNVDLLYMLADAGKGNLVVVGDADQSIYEWRNGSPRHLLAFREHFLYAKQFFMSDNFRSANPILDASNDLIARNVNRIKMSMIGHKDSKTVPYRVQNCRVDQVIDVLRMLKNKQYHYGDIAILTRTNAPLSKVKVLLEKEGIASVSPSDYLIDDNFFIITKDILDMYKDGCSDMAFFRYMKAHGCVLRKRNPDKSLYEDLIKNHPLMPIDTGNMKSMLEYAVSNDRNDEVYTAAKDLFSLFLLFDAGIRPEDAVRYIASVFGVGMEDPAVKAILDHIDHQRLENVGSLRDSLKWMADFKDETKIEYETSPDKVNLMTAHASKGKEFPVVIILQAEDFKETEEERRLFYVAMTRAKRVLFMLESPYKSCEMLASISDYVQTLSMA